MDKTFFEYLISIIVVVPIIVILIITSLKISKASVDKINRNSYVQIIERVSINKEITIYVIKIGETGTVMVSSNNTIETLKELSKCEIEEILKQKKESISSIDLSKIDIKSILNNKFTREKEDGYTK